MNRFEHKVLRNYAVATVIICMLPLSNTTTTFSILAATIVAVDAAVMQYATDVGMSYNTRRTLFLWLAFLAFWFSVMLSPEPLWVSYLAAIPIALLGTWVDVIYRRGLRRRANGDAL